MTIDDLEAALALPEAARVDRRVPKRLLVEKGAPTAADRRAVEEDVEEIRWLAALKPASVGVPAWTMGGVPGELAVSEIAVVRLELRRGRRAVRIVELLHRAIPYPVVLLGAWEGRAALSTAEKRPSLAQADAVVLAGEPLLWASGANDASGDEAIDEELVAALAPARLPRADLAALYGGYSGAVLARLAAARTGAFRVESDPERAAARRAALTRCARADAEIARLHKAGSRERQTARLVALNEELGRARTAFEAALRCL